MKRIASTDGGPESIWTALQDADFWYVSIGSTMNAISLFNMINASFKIPLWYMVVEIFESYKEIVYPLVSSINSIFVFLFELFGFSAPYMSPDAFMVWLIMSASLLRVLLKKLEFAQDEHRGPLLAAAISMIWPLVLIYLIYARLNPLEREKIRKHKEELGVLRMERRTVLTALYNGIYQPSGMGYFDFELEIPLFQKTTRVTSANKRRIIVYGGIVEHCLKKLEKRNISEAVETANAWATQLTYVLAILALMFGMGVNWPNIW